jgi:hypothetical protein
MSFWSGLSLSINRASWVTEQIGSIMWRLIYFGGCIFSIWLTQISYLALMSDEYADAFSYPSKDSARRNTQIVALAGAGFFTAGVLAEFWVKEKERGTTGGVVSSSNSQAQDVIENKMRVLNYAQGNLIDAPVLNAGNFSKLAKVHIDPRALTGAAPAGPQSTGATAAAAALARLPLPSEQRRAPIGTRSRGQYAPMTEAPMPHLNLRH